LNKNFKLKLSPIDERDYLYKNIVKTESLPESYDRTAECSPVRDQGDYGFCYAFAGEGMKEEQEWKEWPDLKPILSPLFLAKCCKAIDGIPDEEGSYLRIVMKVLQDTGICLESNYPYSGYNGNLQFPETSDELYTEASKYKINSYAQCTSLEEVKSAIVNKGIVLGGVLVCTNFLTPENGFVNYPEGTILGYHAIDLVGYDDNLSYIYKNGKTRTGFLKCKNSWSEEYGLDGYFYIPYDYFYGKSDTVTYFPEVWSSIDIVENIPEPVKEYWRVQVGNFAVQNNAINLKNKIINMGISAIIKEKNGFYKVQVGVYIIRENAYKKLDYMKLLGFNDAFIVYC